MKFKTMNVSIKSVFVAVMVAMSVMAVGGIGAVSAADADADETITVGDTSGTADYATVQEAVDNADSSMHTHIEIDSTAYSETERVEISNDDVYFETEASGNTVTIDEVVSPYGNSYSSNADVTVTNELTVHFVGEDASDDFSTIQDALDSAAETDYISVESGTYAENLTVETNDITVVSADGETATIDGDVDSSAVSTFTTGNNVQIGVSGGGGFTLDSSTLQDTVFGVPVFAWLLLIGVGGFIYMKEDDEDF